MSESESSADHFGEAWRAAAIKRDVSTAQAVAAFAVERARIEQEFAEAVSKAGGVDI